LDNRASEEKQGKEKAVTWLGVVANFVKAYANSQSAKQKKERAENRAANWATGATVFIAIFTFVTVGVSIAQWWILSGTLSEMRDEQRPWIGAPISVNGDINEDSKLKINIIFENIGKTPTISFRVDGGIVDGGTIGDENTWIGKANSFCIELASERLGNTFAAIPGSKWPIPSHKMPSGSKFPQTYTFLGMDEPFLAGCVVYKIRGDGDNEIHKTPFGAHLVLNERGIEMDRAYTYDAK
jgi:hypothetical protein